MASLAPIDPTTSTRLALVVGSGSWARGLVDELGSAGLTPAIYSWDEPQRSPRFANLSQPLRFAERLRADDVSEVLHAGACRAAHVVRALAQTRLGFIKHRASRDGLEASYFHPYAEALLNHGVRAVRLRHYLPRYAIAAGALTATAPMLDTHQIQASNLAPSLS